MEVSRGVVQQVLIPNSIAFSYVLSLTPPGGEPHVEITMVVDITLS
ncbi:MAG: hypothetical protein QXV05_02210 [Candidatus Korarchaeum sp.]